MNFSREMSRLMFGLLSAFFIVIASAGYWAIVGAFYAIYYHQQARTKELQAAHLQAVLKLLVAAGERVEWDARHGFPPVDGP